VDNKDNIQARSKAEMALTSWLIASSIEGNSGFVFDEEKKKIRGQLTLSGADIFRFVARKRVTSPYSLPFYIGVPSQLESMFKDVAWRDVIIYEDVILLVTKVALNEEGKPKIGFELGIPISPLILDAIKKGHAEVLSRINKVNESHDLEIDFCLYDNDEMDDKQILVSSLKPVKKVVFRLVYHPCFAKGEMTKLSHSRPE